jgi:hypothetical protein
MLIPAEIILDNILEDRADIPINAIHMHSGLKADLYPVREGDELWQSAFRRRQQVNYGHPIGKVYISNFILARFSQKVSGFRRKRLEQTAQTG